MTKLNWNSLIALESSVIHYSDASEGSTIVQSKSSGKENQSEKSGPSKTTSELTNKPSNYSATSRQKFWLPFEKKKCTEKRLSSKSGTATSRLIQGEKQCLITFKMRKNCFQL